MSLKREGISKRYRRIAGLLNARLPDLRLDFVLDRRRRQGRLWSLPTILKTVLVGLMSGCTSLAQVESLTAEMSNPMRRWLGIQRRLADTTMRDVLVRVLPYELRQTIYRMMKAALRRKALPLSPQLPFHAAALDGKATSTDTWDNHYAQQVKADDGKKAYGLVRMVNAVLVSTASKPLLDSVPIPADTNEMGIFPIVFEALQRTYGDLIRLVTYDAGATSQEHCQLVVDADKHFLFRIKNDNWLILQAAKRFLGLRPPSQATAHTEDVLSKSEKVSIHRYFFAATVLRTSFWGFPQVKTFIRVLSEKVRDGQVIAQENRYFISSLPVNSILHSQWLALVRNHWGVENNLHWTLDVIFNEDDKPGIHADARGMVVMMLLRRIAYNLLALFRSVTQRSDDKRQTPWKDLLRWVYQTLIAATDVQLHKLRRREVASVTP